jgi:hypothetical protein
MRCAVEPVTASPPAGSRRRPVDSTGTLAALGGLSAAVYAAAVPAAGWLGLEPLALHLAAFGLVFALYVAALWRIPDPGCSERGGLVVILGFALLFRLLVVGTPIYLSSDIYRYLWDGRVQLAGIDPYRYPPAAPELVPLRDGAVHPNINRPWAITVYPPATQWLFAVAAATTGGTIPGWRALLLGAEVATVWLLLRLLRRLGKPPAAVLAYAWSPLVVFEGIQAGHVDVAVVAPILLALSWRARGASGRAGIALGVAILMKLYPAILLLAWWRRGDRRFPLATLGTVGAGYLPYVLSVGTGALGFLPVYLSSQGEDFNIGLRALLTFPFGFAEPGVRALAMALLFGLLGVAVLWIGRTASADALGLCRAGARAVGAYLVLVPTAMHPWYVLWAVPFLCLAPWSPWLFFSGTVTLSYVEYLRPPSAPFPWWVWLAEYGPLWTLLGVSCWRARQRRRAPVAGAVRPG